MKLYEVYFHEPFEVPYCRMYFLDVTKAKAYLNERLKEEPFWEMGEIETEDNPNGVGDLED